LEGLSKETRELMERVGFGGGTEREEGEEVVEDEVKVSSRAFSSDTLD
jgi:hypothetical protein